MVVTIMVIALVSVITTTAAAVTMNNLGSARSSADAALALDSADAGLAQALAYLRTFGVAEIDCSPTCDSNPYGNEANPASVVLNEDTEQSYEVWIEPVAPLPEHNPGIYTVHSTGYGGSGVRSIEADISLGSLPIGLPMAVVADTVSGGGNAGVSRESIFTTGCVSRRSKIAFAGIDAAYGIPAAVHSSQYISDSTNTNANCGPSNKDIHQATGGGKKGGSGTSAAYCNAAYPYDQDVLGGDLTGTPCAAAMSTYPEYYAPRDFDGDGQLDVVGSFIRDDETLRELYGIPEEPFTAAQLDTLRAVAQAQGTYFTEASGFTSPDPAVTPNAVMFFDLEADDPGGMVDLNDVDGWGRADNLSADSPQCASRSLLIIIAGGNARLNSNQRMAASIVLTSDAPYGEVVKANGTADLIGTIFASSVAMVGTLNLSLDECFMENISPSLLDTTANVIEYREIDRSLD